MKRFDVDLEMQGDGVRYGSCVPVDAKDEKDAIEKAKDLVWKEGWKFEALHKGQIVVGQVTEQLTAKNVMLAA